MATNSPPTRIDGDLYESARLAAAAYSRSTAQQITHWARIGRELEAAPAVSQRAIGEVLAGARSYDSLTDKEQAIVRAEWAERIEARRVGLDLEARFAAEGRPYAVLDEHGEVVVIDGADESAAAS